MDGCTGSINIRAGVSGALPTGRNSDTFPREGLVIACAGLENVVPRVGRGVEGASLGIINVLTVLGSVGTLRVASLQAELVVSNKVVPFNSLNEGSSERIGEKDTPQWIATIVSTMGVHFTACVTGRNVDFGLVDEPNNLNVVWAFDKLDSSESTVRNNARAVSWPCAPGYHLSFNFSYRLSGIGRRPETKVIE